jgi:hypothetical protein
LYEFKDLKVHVYLYARSRSFILVVPFSLTLWLFSIATIYLFGDETMMVCETQTLLKMETEWKIVKFIIKKADKQMLLCSGLTCKFAIFIMSHWSLTFSEIFVCDERMNLWVWKYIANAGGRARRWIVLLFIEQSRQRELRKNYQGNWREQEQDWSMFIISLCAS